MSRYPILAALGAAAVLAACAEQPAKLAATTPPSPKACGDFSFPIYFDKNSDQLTAAARAVVSTGVAQAKGCVVSKVEVLGLADADGPANRNLALSRRRAARVTEALKADGIPAPVFDIEAIGEVGAKALDGKPEPLRRRTEVVIHAAPKAS